MVLSSSVTVRTGLTEFEMHWLFKQAAETLRQSKEASIYFGFGVKLCLVEVTGKTQTP